MSKENDFPAFAAGGNPSLQHIQQEGISARDYFAAKAVQGMVANPGMWDLINERHAQSVAKDAYLIADAMLEARNK